MKKIVLVLMFGFCFAHSAYKTVEFDNKTLKIDKLSPFEIGNKTFRKFDLQDFSEQEIDDLVEISESSCCLSCGALSPYYFDKLRSMRPSIKQGMIVQRCSYDKIIDDRRVERCSDATTCCAIAAPFALGCGWISFGCKMSKVVLLGLVCGWAGAVSLPCSICTAYTCCQVCCCKSIREEKSNF